VLRSVQKTEWRRRARPAAVAALAALVLTAGLALSGCGGSSGAAGGSAGVTPSSSLVSPVAGTTGPPASPGSAASEAAAQALLGKRFPTARAKDLTGVWVSMPRDWRGGALIVLVTPSKASQPDADKWITYLRPREEVRFRETPIIDSSAAHFISGFIKSQMKGGLPKDMWARVIPVFEGAGAVKDFFGDLGDTVAWVAVLDDAGTVRWLHAGGFSGKAAAAAVAELKQLQ
jgi:hypothetical protein